MWCNFCNRVRMGYTWNLWDLCWDCHVARWRSHCVAQTSHYSLSKMFVGVLTFTGTNHPPKGKIKRWNILFNLFQNKQRLSGTLALFLLIFFFFHKRRSLCRHVSSVHCSLSLWWGGFPTEENNVCSERTALQTQSQGRWRGCFSYVDFKHMLAHLALWPTWVEQRAMGMLWACLRGQHYLDF